MNAEQRKRVNDAITLIREGINVFEEVASEEDDKVSNLPDNLSSKAEEYEEKATLLRNAYETIEDELSSVESEL
jgi:hypothetical protein